MLHATDNAIENLRKHRGHMAMMADPYQTRNMIEQPTQDFVRAISTAARLLKAKNKLPQGPGHKNRIAKLTSRTAALRTKKAVIQSAARTQAGLGFFSDLGAGIGNLAPMAAHLLPLML